jgi:hypothetical protein
MDPKAFSDFFEGEVDRGIPGWFHGSDALLFYLIAEFQRLGNVGGDLCELGVHRGRSAVVLGRLKRPGERLFCVDRFSLEAGVLEEFRRHRARLLPEAGDEVVVVDCPDLLALDAAPAPVAGAALRFLHVDAGHSHREVLNDLRNFAPLLAGGGAIPMDDAFDPDFPGVATAIAEHCLSEAGRDLRVFATSRRKAYLCHRPWIRLYQGFLARSGALPKVHMDWVLDVRAMACFSSWGGPAEEVWARETEAGPP